MDTNEKSEENEREGKAKTIISRGQLGNERRRNCEDDARREMVG